MGHHPLGYRPLESSSHSLRRELLSFLGIRLRFLAYQVVFFPALSSPWSHISCRLCKVFSISECWVYKSQTQLLRSRKAWHTFIGWLAAVFDYVYHVGELYIAAGAMCVSCTLVLRVFVTGYERISVITALQIDAILPSIASPIDFLSRSPSSILWYVRQHPVTAKRIRSSWDSGIDN